MRNLVFSFTLLLALFSISLAQSNTGNLSGTVSDASGVIAGATVVIKDNQTGRERTLVTNSEGAFAANQLEVGNFTVTIKATGHKTQTYSDVKIDIGQTYTLTATLEAGDISEVVTVAAGADIVNSANAELSTTVSARQIVELPLNGRNPLTLVLLQAGSSSNSAQTTTINGQRSSFTNITRDGINIQDNFIRANAVDFLPDRPNVDDTGEFTVVTQNAGADLGYGASQVQLVTPRGSNDFHGAAYIYNRNSEFAANSFFNNNTNVKRPFLNRNQFGGKVSGPIWKNKLFFFFGYEGFRLRQSVSAQRTILTPSARNGIFTYRDSTGVTRTVNIFAAAVGGTTGGSGPATGIDPTINSRILANLPSAGNDPTLGDQGLNTTGLRFSVTSNQDREAISSRFDFDMNDKNSFSGVYTYKQEINERTDLSAQQGAANCCYTTSPLGFQDANTPFLALSWRWAPTANITNEVRGGWQGSDPIFGINQDSPAFFIQVPAFINNPESGFQPQGRRTDIYNVQDNLAWIKGNHTFRFGGSFDMYRADPFGPGAFGAPYIPNYVLGGGNTPTFTQASFNAAAAVGCVTTGPTAGTNCIPAAQVATANSLLALLGGQIGSAGQTFNADSQTGTLNPVPPARELAFEHWGFYAADQWRLTPSFTLNYGLRYELYTPIREPNGLALEAVQGGRDIITTVLDPAGTYNFVGTNNGGHNFFKTDKNNFAPVVSFAWTPTFENKWLNTLFPGGGKTVVRGGYRLSYVNDEFIRAADNALAGNAGLSQGLTVPTGSSTSVLNARLSAPPTFTAPPLTVPRTYAQNNAIAGNFGTVFAIDPDIQVPGWHEFNIGVQREIGWDTALEVRYVHAQTNDLVRGVDLNQVNVNSAFLADFTRARNNFIATNNPNCGTITPLPAGCTPLQLFNTAAFNNGAILTNGTLRNNLLLGNAGEVALNFLQLGGTGNSFLLANPNTGAVDLLKNEAKANYNALQVEVRRRFSDGLTFQANYTFQKQLTDAPGTGQTRFEPYIDNASPTYEYGIGDQDTTHVFNLNAIYELPIGKGKYFFTNVNGWVDRLIGGWQLTSIVRISSGAPFTVTDPRGTLNRTARSARQSAITSLTKQEVRQLVGVFRTPCGVFFMNPQVINLDLAKCSLGTIAPRVAGTVAGTASLGYDPQGLPGGVKSFPGQVFFNVAPGQLGNMEFNFLSGPMYFNWDGSIIKNIPITERVRVQLRAEAFNMLNRPHFGITGQFTQANINSTSFGRIASAPSSRVIQFVGRVEF